MSANPQNPKRIWPIFVVGLIALALFYFGTLILLSSSGPAADEGAARSAERTKAYADLQAENKKQLETFAWADKAKGTVQIPIDLAIQLTLPRLQSQQPAPAGPINVPPPAATPEATPAGLETGTTPISEPVPTEAPVAPTATEPAPTGEQVTP